MSYCRFSTDNWKSDVYVYHGDSYITHVATKRRIFAPIPNIPYRFTNFLKYKYDKETKSLIYPNKFYTFIAKYIWCFLYFWNKYLHMKLLSIIPLVDIKLQHTGEMFHDYTAKDCIIRLKYLEKLGYNIPQSAISLLLIETNQVDAYS